MDNSVWQRARDGIMGFNYDVLKTLPLMPADTWEGSVQHSLLNTSPAELPSNQPCPSAKYVNAAAVMMIKDEADIIGYNLGWLYHLGIRRLIVTDNSSSDNSKEIIDFFRKSHHDVELIYIYDPIVRHIQAEITTGMHQMAKSIWRDVNWIFLIDADEFLVPQRGLLVLDTIDASVTAITLQKCVHHLNKKIQPATTNFFTRMNIRSSLFSHGPKVALRAVDAITIGRGNHRAHYNSHFNNDLKYIAGTSLGLYYREFPIRSFAHFMRKSIVGANAVSAAEKAGLDVGGGHWKRWFSIYLEHGEAGLYDFYQQHMVRMLDAHSVEDTFDPSRFVDASSENVFFDLPA